MKIKPAQALELTTFKLNGYTAQQFIKANGAVDEFLFRQKGFRSRTIIELNDGLIADILTCDSVADGRHAMHKLMIELANSEVHAMINQSTVDWNITSIKHFVTLENE